jgi:hypothetical protein
VLTDGDALALERWVGVANSWSEAAQALVGAASELGIESRELATRFGGRDPDPSSAAAGAPSFSARLETLAGSVESETSELRDRYLATAATLDQYREFLP